MYAEHADQLFRRLAASRFDGSHDVDLCRLAGVDLLIIGDFALPPTSSCSKAILPPTPTFTGIAASLALFVATVGVVAEVT